MDGRRLVCGGGACPYGASSAQARALEQECAPEVPVQPGGSGFGSVRSAMVIGARFIVNSFGAKDVWLFAASASGR